jgi:PAS domain S-box-containing protein
LKILVVDDNEDNRCLLETLLSKSGYEVVSAGNGVKALEKLRKDSVDIIISDILMPVMDGFRLCRECKTDDSLMKIPFVFYTSTYTDRKDEAFALNLGAEKVLIKPLEPNELLRVLKTILEDHRNALPITQKISIEDEETYLTEYNKRLVKQLEKKVLDLEKAMAERKQAERRTSAQHFVTQVLVDSATIKEAFPKILQAVCRALEWDLGEIWEFDQQKKALYNTEIWHVSSLNVSEFIAAAKQITFPLQIGLPGRVWETAQPLWIADVVHDTNFLRAPVADKEGLHGAFGFPILSGSEVLGTICFFSHEIREPDKELLDMLNAIGRQIGLFIKRKQADEKIRKLSHAIEYSSATVMITDSEGNIEYANPKFTQLTGYSLEEAIGETPRIIKSGKTPPEVYKELWAAITSGSEWRGEFCNRKKDGELYWEYASISPVKNDGDIITNFVAVKDDITEHRRMEEDIVKVQKFESLAVLAGGIAHDFNNFQAVILGNIEIMKMSIKPEDEIFKNLTNSENALMQAGDLARQLISFAKGGDPVSEVVSISELIKKLTKLALSGSAVRSEFCLPEDTWLIDADKGQIGQVISNLVINAKQAMPEGGIIKVNAENINVTTKDFLPLNDGKYVKVILEDTGTGISDEHLKNIFDPYYTTKEKGSGLGLATTYSIIKKHDGHITVVSEIGVGTIFYIYLPALIQSEGT